MAGAAAGMQWWSAEYLDALTGPITVTLSGAACVPELIPLALVGLAGLGAALATSGLFADNVADDGALQGPLIEPADASGLGVRVDEASVDRLRIR